MVKTGTDGPIVLQADRDMVPELCGLIRKTIRETYAKYCPEEAVRFFPELHGDEAVRKDVSDGSTYVVKAGGIISAAGTLDGDRIRRLFVLPEYRESGRGVRSEG